MWAIIFQLGGLGFWLAAMLTLPDNAPYYVKGFATFALWSFAGIFVLLNEILKKVK